MFQHVFGEQIYMIFYRDKTKVNPSNKLYLIYQAKMQEEHNNLDKISVNSATDTI
jgi:hypothetical protein